MTKIQIINDDVSLTFTHKEILELTPDDLLSCFFVPLLHCLGYHPESISRLLCDPDNCPNKE